MGSSGIKHKGKTMNNYEASVLIGEVQKVTKSLKKFQTVNTDTTDLIWMRVLSDAVMELKDITDNLIYGDGKLANVTIKAQRQELGDDLRGEVQLGRCRARRRLRGDGVDRAGRSVGVRGIGGEFLTATPSKANGSLTIRLRRRVSRPRPSDRPGSRPPSGRGPRRRSSP